MDDELYVASMDAETVSQDFDDIDLFGERLIEDDTDTDIAFE